MGVGAGQSLVGILTRQDRLNDQRTDCGNERTDTLPAREPKLQVTHSNSNLHVLTPAGSLAAPDHSVLIETVVKLQPSSAVAEKAWEMGGAHEGRIPA